MNARRAPAEADALLDARLLRVRHGTGNAVRSST
jgi:hypothetical protein